MLHLHLRLLDLNINLVPHDEKDKAAKAGRPFIAQITRHRRADRSRFAGDCKVEFAGGVKLAIRNYQESERVWDVSHFQRTKLLGILETWRESQNCTLPRGIRGFGLY